MTTFDMMPHSIGRILSQTPRTSGHPPCLEVTADQASRNFVNPRQYPVRFRKLKLHLSQLWGRDSCDIRKCADCGFGFADPFVAGGAEFYNLAAPHPSYPSMK
jgi:hypothetical protein